ncbi:unnamed protein product [Notodromas monacha]|uniref:Uncharacterized protein n=1 Tax=Notodromas monacha TaxID=399045 RepID=A0A7R9GBE4_9CRUS|nr:unnamed protein product [Notodromas monacha]CAG0914917.1 unnamed protein product [Notodromas monacha]
MSPGSELTVFRRTGFPAAAAAAYAAYGRGLAAYPGIGFPYPAGNVSSTCHNVPVLPFPFEPRVLNLHAMPLITGHPKLKPVPLDTFM